MPNTRVKIIWDDSNITKYQTLLSNNLSSIRNRWANASSTACFSLLLSSTNDALMSAATASNKFIKLGKPTNHKPTKYPEIEAAQSASLLASRCLQNLIENPRATPEAVRSAKVSLASAKAALQKTVRKSKFNACYARDSKLFTILEKNPS